jgi:transcriptional regulator with XRE-family HTH domain
LAVVDPHGRGGAHPSIGWRVRRLRDKRQLTQEALAGLVGRTRRWLISVEQDEVDIRFSDLLRLADALQIPVAQLIDPSAPRERATSAGHDPRRRSTLDQRWLEDIRRLLDDAGRKYWDLPPRSLLPSVRALLATLQDGLRGTENGPLRRPLLSLTAETAALEGFLAFRLDNRGDAGLSFRMAEDLAEAAGDQPLRAHALVGLHALYSSVPLGGHGGDTAAALAMLDEAERAAGRAADPLLRTWIHAGRAEEHAVLGDPIACQRDLDDADRALSSAGRRTTGFFSHWDRFRLAGFRGNCLLILGHPREAAATLAEALRNTPPSLLGPYACVCADLGAAHAQLGDVERACDLLSRGLAVACRAEAGPDGIERIAGIRNRYIHADSPVVKDLDEQLLLAR